MVNECFAIIHTQETYTRITNAGKIELINCHGQRTKDRLSCQV